MIYAFTFILALCSLVYELLLGQTLSAFLGNTVLRYSVTIGLYMLSMGVGALLAEGRVTRHPVISLLKVELLLTVAGGTSVLLLHVVNAGGAPDWAFSLIAHGLIVAIGVLTGAEIPLLMELRALDDREAENAVLGVDYLGAFCGTLLFAFVFYPYVGLLQTGFFVAVLNAGVGVLLFTQAAKVEPDRRAEYQTWLAVQSLAGFVLLTCLFSATEIDRYFLTLYLNS